MGNYTKSNKITTIEGLKFLDRSKILYKRFREQIQISQAELQELSDSICSDLSLKRISVSFKGNQPNARTEKRLKNKTLGIYNTAGYIQVYKYTAVRRKELAPKTAISTLLHELNHYFDYAIVGLTKSVHSKGFYLRLKQFTEKIS